MVYAPPTLPHPVAGLLLYSYIQFLHALGGGACTTHFILKGLSQPWLLLFGSGTR
jgi:hypothetical protein